MGNQPDEVRLRPLPARGVLVGLGPLPARLLAELAQGLSAALGIAWQAAPALQLPGYAFNEARRQYHAPAVVRRLAAQRPAGGLVLGVIAADVFLPDDGPYVLGDADRDAGAALLGLGRLVGGDPAALRHRARVEALHLLGHLLGLSGCLDLRCAMYPSRDAADADRKALGLCPSCRAAVGLP